MVVGLRRRFDACASHARFSRWEARALGLSNDVERQLHTCLERYGSVVPTSGWLGVQQKRCEMGDVTFRRPSRSGFASAPVSHGRMARRHGRRGRRNLGKRRPPPLSRPRAVRMERGPVLPHLGRSFRASGDVDMDSRRALDGGRPGPKPSHRHLGRHFNRHALGRTALHRHRSEPHLELRFSLGVWVATFLHRIHGRFHFNPVLPIDGFTHVGVPILAPVRNSHGIEPSDEVRRQSRPGPSHPDHHHVRQRPNHDFAVSPCRRKFRLGSNRWCVRDALEGW